MSPFQPANNHFRGHRFSRSAFIFHRPRPYRVSSPRTPDVERTFFFRIEVHHCFAFEKSPLQVACSRQACLFIHSKQKFQGAMLQRFVRHDSKVAGNSDSVIRSQCCAVRHHEISLPNHFDRILQKIVHLVLVFLGHHIKVTLQTDHLPVFPSG